MLIHKLIKAIYINKSRQCILLLFSILLFFGSSVYGNQKCNDLNKFLNKALSKTTYFEEDSLIKMGQKFIDLDCPDQILAYNLLGFIKYNNAKFLEAKDLLLKGEAAHFREKSKLNYYSTNQDFLALVEIVEKDFEGALLHLTKAMKIAKSTENYSQLAYIYHNFGYLYMETKNFDKAEEYLLKVIDMDSSVSEKTGYTYQSLSYIYKKRGDYENALKIVLKAKKIWETLNHKKGLYYVSMIQSGILTSLNQPDAALETLLKGRAIAESICISLSLGENYILEASIYENKKNIPKEITALKNALHYYDQISYEQFETLINRLTEIGDGQNKNQLIKSLLSINQQIKKNNTKNRETQLNKEEILGNKIENVEAKANKQMTITGVLLGFVLLISGFLFRIFRQNKQIKFLNNKLVTSNKKIEIQIKKLEMHNDELKNFAYVASHDLKSPLKIINSFANLIDKKLNGQAQQIKPYLFYIQNATNTMSQMISDLLEHATIQNDLKIKPNSFSKIVNASINNLLINIEKTNAKITIKQIDTDEIYCDEIKMTTLIQNLIENAINYAKPNEDPKIEITTKIESNIFSISVKDFGIGIEPKYQLKIFEMFSRLKHKKDVNGTGIGLSTCLKIVKFHKGSISVNSALNEGSEFFIELPLFVSHVNV